MIEYRISETTMGARRFGKVNWRGTWTLIGRETRRFLAIPTQTVLAPIVTAGLFLLIFSIAVGDGRADVNGHPFLVFLVPGLIMMTVIQNAFGNTSSSLLSAKVMGNIVDTLMPPLSASEILAGYILGGVVRGCLIAAVMAVAAYLILSVGIAHPIWWGAFVVFGSAFMASLGMLAGIIAQKFDQMAAVTNFVVTPLAFLSGTFYSIRALPEILQPITQMNPMFYIIDGGRFGMLGSSDAPPLLGLLCVIAATAVLLALAHRWIASGYRLKS